MIPTGLAVAQRPRAVLSAAARVTMTVSIAIALPLSLPLSLSVSLSVWFGLLALLLRGCGCSVPTYYIDPRALQIFSARANACLRASGSSAGPAQPTALALAELALLRQESASEFFRGHELLAYHYFVQAGHANPHRRRSREDAEFEYVSSSHTN